jgi:hypothetical protein
MVVYYSVIKRDLNRRLKLIHECRCDERLKTKSEGSTRLTYTGLCGELEHLKIETRLIGQRFASVMGECEISHISTNLVDNPLSIKLCPLTFTSLTCFPKEYFLLDCPGLGLR